MTSQAATRALIERYIDAFNAKDRAALLDLLGDDVAHDINQGGREIGRDKFGWFLAMKSRHYDEILADVAIMVSADGQRAAAEGTIRGTYRSTAEGELEAHGQRYRLPIGLFFDIDDGRITRVTSYHNVTEWRRQISKDA